MRGLSRGKARTGKAGGERRHPQLTVKCFLNVFSESKGKSLREGPLLFLCFFYQFNFYSIVALYLSLICHQFPTYFRFL